MIAPLGEVCCACLPAASLALLADLRCHEEVRVLLRDERAWVYWLAGDEPVLLRVLAVPGAEMFVRRGPFWFRHGSRLPSVGVPHADEAQTLHRVLTPAYIQPSPPTSDLPPPVALRLVPTTHRRETTALLCSLSALARWADMVPSARLSSLRAACLDGQVLLRGARLPVLSACERFWGDRVLIPLGRGVEPDLPAEALRNALNIGPDEILLLREDRAEVVPQEVLQPLTRAGIRLALEKIATDAHG